MLSDEVVGAVDAIASALDILNGLDLQVLSTADVLDFAERYHHMLNIEFPSTPRIRGYNKTNSSGVRNYQGAPPIWRAQVTHARHRLTLEIPWGDMP